MNVNSDWLPYFREKGYGDFHLVPDMATLRIVSWQYKTAIVLCDVHDPKNHDAVDVAPRNILKKQLARAKNNGYKAFGASELEYYMYRNSYQDFAKNHYVEQHLQPFGWYLEDYNILQGTRGEELNAKVRKYLKTSGIEVENSKGEYGIGQHELNIRFSDVLDMCDKHVLYKQCFKETADKLGYSVTFMAKPHATQSGNSCHIHINLATETSNAFVGDKDFYGLKCSNIFNYFLGGCLKFLPEVMVFLAPTINSYKRYQSASWAPTRLAWSIDNRTAGFRIVGQDSKSLRIECRIPGADANPYLAFAGILACGLEGVEKKIDAPAQIKGDIYKLQSVARVPKTLYESISLFNKSAFTKKAFGESVVKHYSHFYSEEVESFNRSVTDWERKRYFEQV